VAAVAKAAEGGGGGIPGGVELEAVATMAADCGGGGSPCCRIPIGCCCDIGVPGGGCCGAKPGGDTGGGM